MLHFSSILDETLSRWSSQNMISSNKIFTVPSSIGHIFSPFCAINITSLRVEPLSVYIVHLLKVCHHEDSVPNFLRPRTRRFRGVFRVMLYFRIGGTSTGQKQNWSDNQSTIQIKFFDSTDSSMHLSLFFFGSLFLADSGNTR